MGKVSHGCNNMGEASMQVAQMGARWVIVWRVDESGARWGHFVKLPLVSILRKETAIMSIDNSERHCMRVSVE